MKSSFYKKSNYVTYDNTYRLPFVLGVKRLIVLCKYKKGKNKPEWVLEDQNNRKKRKV